MKKENKAKIKLLKLYELLQCETDEDNYLETAEILQKLAKEGIVCDRNTLYKDIETLNESGYEVLCEKEPGKPNKYGIADRKFTEPELRILTDAVQAAAFISEKKTEELVNKIAELGGRNKAELLKKNVVKFNTTKSKNESVLYSVSEISAAIESGRKISFRYFNYDKNHKKVYRRRGERYIVNPLATIYDNNYYYLIVYDGRHNDVVHYRVDRMDGVEMLETRAEIYTGAEQDLQKHKKTLFGMYQGKAEEVEFEIASDIVDRLFDTFGDEIRFEDKGDGKLRFKAEVQISPTFVVWCLSFGDKLKVIAPEKVRERLSSYTERLYNLYKN